MAIKTGNKKLSLNDPLDVFVAKWAAAYQLDLLPIQVSHTPAVVGLTNHHKDPFDRVSIAQALIEGMTLVSGDNKFVPYSVPIIW